MDEELRTVWCGNLSEKVTEEILYELFLQAGPLEKVRIPKGNDGKQRTFGFITFKHECSVPYAIELFEGTKLFNRSLNLKEKQGSIVMDSPASLNRQNSHHRTQSAPVGNNEIPNLDFDSLLQMGQQQMFHPGRMGMHFSNSCYSQYQGSPTHSSHLASKIVDLHSFNLQSHSLTQSSLQGNWSTRNHPYGQGGKHRRTGNEDYNNLKSQYYHRRPSRDSDRRGYR